MPQPNDAPSFPAGINLTYAASGHCNLSQHLVNLLIHARNEYDWPAGTGAKASQQTILNLTNTVRLNLATLTPANAHSIIMEVSCWAGNNANSHAKIVGASVTLQDQMKKAITSLVTPGHESTGIDALCALPGIGLVIASKIFRFCTPTQGAAVDRHASYFSNSLPVVGGGTATQFVREWVNSHHTISRLAIYNANNYNRNRTEYFSTYLPLLSCIAETMNANAISYTCGARNIPVTWTPADVEMAAYYWWATNGAR
jgi:endonuclease III